MEPTHLVEPLASPHPEHEASSRPATAALAVGLTVLAFVVLLLLLFLIAPSAGAAGGCGGG